jgi:sulfopropanediol 3-dehydrogenase
MAVWLKHGRSAEDRTADDAKVRETVERALDDITTRGDASVREMSEPASAERTPG